MIFTTYPYGNFFVDLEHTDEYYKRTGTSPDNPVNINNDGIPNNINAEYSLGLNVITINALDGSIIDRSLGY